MLAFALFEASGPSMNAKVGSWLGKVGKAYEVSWVSFRSEGRGEAN